MGFQTADIEWMRKGADLLLGEHDFSAFRAWRNAMSITPVKTVKSIGIEKQGNLIVFTFEANAFLHHMVRNIVGSLVYVGKGNHPHEWMRQLLDAKDRFPGSSDFHAGRPLPVARPLRCKMGLAATGRCFSLMRDRISQFTIRF